METHLKATDAICVGGELISILDAASKYKMASSEQILDRIREGWNGSMAALTPADDVIDKIERNYFGLHVGLDIFNASPSKINCLNTVHNFLRDLPEAIGMARISPPVVFHYEDPDPTRSGISGVVFLSTSSCDYHAFPHTEGYYSLNVFSCKPFSPYLVLAEAMTSLGGDTYQISIALRGHGFKNRL